jgi:hypothetical protein
MQSKGDFAHQAQLEQKRGIQRRHRACAIDAVQRLNTRPGRGMISRRNRRGGGRRFTLAAGVLKNAGHINFGRMVLFFMHVELGQQKRIDSNDLCNGRSSPAAKDSRYLIGV